jgi:hypothetical protein
MQQQHVRARWLQRQRPVPRRQPWQPQLQQGPGRPWAEGQRQHWVLLLLLLLLLAPRRP